MPVKVGGGGLGLTRFFLRARPVRTAAVLMTVMAFVLFLAVAVVRSLSLDGPGFASTVMGRADGIVTQAGVIGLGHDDAAVDRALRVAVRRAGGDAAQVGYESFSQFPDTAAGRRVVLREGEWTGAAAPVVAQLQSGRWSARPGEAVVSPSMSRTWPVGSTLSFYGQALRVRVVGVAVDAYAKSTDAVLLPPGTFSSIRLPAARAVALNVIPDRVVTWRGNADTAVVNRAVQTALAATDAQAGALSVESQLQLRAVAERYSPSLTFQLILGSVVAPLVGGLIAAIIAARFITRIRRTMWTIGIAWAQTRRASLTAVFLATAVGSMVGSALGLAAGFAVRPLLATFWDRQLGPIDGLGAPAVSFVVSALVGVGLGLLVLRQPVLTTEVQRQQRAQLVRVGLPVGGILCVVAAFAALAVSTSNDPVMPAVAAFLFGLALVLGVPAVFLLLARVRPTSMPLLLAIRRILADRYSSGWVLVGAASLLLLGFSGSTFVASAYAYADKQIQSLAPPGQIQFRPQVTPAQRTAVQQKFEKALKLSDPVTVHFMSQATSSGSGSTLVVGSVAALERILEHKVPTRIATALNDGAVANTAPGTIADFQLDDGSTVRLPSVHLTGLGPAWSAYQGFTLASTVRAHRQLSLDDEPLSVYVPVSQKQQAGARAAASRAGIDPGWIQVYRAPDHVQQSTTTILSGATLSLLAGLLMAFVAAAEARALRPTLAGIRAVGVRSSWLARALLYRSLLLVVIALVVAAGASILGLAVIAGLTRLPLALTPPLPAMTATATVMLVVTAIAGASSARRLRLAERTI